MSRLVQVALRCFPSEWRLRYGDEVAALIDELVSHGDATGVGALAGLIATGFGLRWRGRARSAPARARRHLLLGGVVAASGLLALGVAGLVLPSAHAPSASDAEHPHLVRQVVVLDPRTGLLLGFLRHAQRLNEAATVFGPGLRSAIGTLVPGRGLVPFGQEEPCQVAAAERVTTGAPPCPSWSVVLPELVGELANPALGRLSALGLGARVRLVADGSQEAGRVLRTRPKAGATLRARQVVTVAVGAGASTNAHRAPAWRSPSSSSHPPPLTAGLLAARLEVRHLGHASRRSVDNSPPSSVHRPGQGQAPTPR